LTKFSYQNLIYKQKVGTLKHGNADNINKHHLMFDVWNEIFFFKHKISTEETPEEALPNTGLPTWIYDR